MNSERKQQLDENLVMYFTGFTRFSSEIQKSNMISGENKIKQRLEMLELVDQAEKILNDDTISLDEFGKLLDYTWQLKRQTGSAITTARIDDIYNRGMAAGALGGKLLGAGGGGFLIFYVQPEKKDMVKKAMSDLLYVPFHFENSGTRVIYYSEE